MEWTRVFLEELAATSDVEAAAKKAGVNVEDAYRLRRTEAVFAQDWHTALLEGCQHLEMETLRRLRKGVPKDDPKFDIPNALRFLSMHRDAVEKHRSQREERDEETIIAAIQAKLAAMRAREMNVTRMLANDGVGVPQLPGADG